MRFAYAAEQHCFGRWPRDFNLLNLLPDKLSLQRQGRKERLRLCTFALCPRGGRWFVVPKIGPVKE